MIYVTIEMAGLHDAIGLEVLCDFIAKQLGAKALGYKYEFWIISDNRDLFDIID